MTADDLLIVREVNLGLFMVPPYFDRSRREIVHHAVAVRLLVEPFTDCGKHVAVQLEAFVTDGWVMKCPYNIVHYFVDRNTRVLPCVEDTTVAALTLGTLFDSFDTFKSNTDAIQSFDNGNGV